jgi:hypothetical protein
VVEETEVGVEGEVGRQEEAAEEVEIDLQKVQISEVSSSDVLSRISSTVQFDRR